MPRKFDKLWNDATGKVGDETNQPSIVANAKIGSVIKIYDSKRGVWQKGIIVGEDGGKYDVYLRANHVGNYDILENVFLSKVKFKLGEEIGDEERALFMSAHEKQNGMIWYYCRHCGEDLTLECRNKSSMKRHEATCEYNPDSNGGDSTYERSDSDESESESESESDDDDEESQVADKKEKSSYKGVGPNKKCPYMPYRARCWKDGEHNLGTFRIKCDAGLAYDKATVKLHGKNAPKINFTSLEDYEQAKKIELNTTGLDKSETMTVSEIETRVNEQLLASTKKRKAAESNESDDDDDEEEECVNNSIATKKRKAEKRNAANSDSGDDEMESDDEDDDETSVDQSSSPRRVSNSPSSSSSRASRGSADKTDDNNQKKKSSNQVKENSSYKGVTSMPWGWRSRRYSDGTDYYLGMFKSECDAGLAYDKAVVLLCIENAETNFTSLEDYEQAKMIELNATGLDKSDTITVNEIEMRVIEQIASTKKRKAPDSNESDDDDEEEECVNSDDDEGEEIDGSTVKEVDQSSRPRRVSNSPSSSSSSSSSRASRGSVDKTDDMSFGGNENDASFDEDQSSAAADESKNNDDRGASNGGQSAATGWIRKWSTTEDKCYWHHHTTDKTTWNDPNNDVAGWKKDYTRNQKIPYWVHRELSCVCSWKDPSTTAGWAELWKGTWVHPATKTISNVCPHTDDSQVSNEGADEVANEGAEEGGNNDGHVVSNTDRPASELNDADPMMQQLLESKEIEILQQNIQERLDEIRRGGDGIPAIQGHDLLLQQQQHVNKLVSEYDTAVAMEKQWDEDYNKKHPNLPPRREGEDGHHIIKANKMIQAKKAELKKRKAYIEEMMQYIFTVRFGENEGLETCVERRSDETEDEKDLFLKCETMLTQIVDVQFSAWVLAAKAVVAGKAYRADKSRMNSVSYELEQIRLAVEGTKSRLELEQKNSQLEVSNPVLRELKELKEAEVKATENVLEATEKLYQEKKAEKERMEQEADDGWFHKFDKLLQEKLTVYVGNIVYKPTASLLLQRVNE